MRRHFSIIVVLVFALASPLFGQNGSGDDDYDYETTIIDPRGMALGAN